MDIDLPPVEVFGTKLAVGVELIDRLPKGLGVPDHLADGCPIVGLQHASEGGGDDGHGVQRDVVLVDSLQIGPGTATILWGRRTLAPEADGIVASRVQG